MLQRLHEVVAVTSAAWSRASLQLRRQREEGEFIQEITLFCSLTGFTCNGSTGVLVHRFRNSENLCSFAPNGPLGQKTLYQAKIG